MNDVMSFGIHRLWKDCFVKQIMPTRNLTFLDVAGGTGDIAFRIYKFSRHSRQAVSADTPITTGPNITLCDINPAMIEVGKAKAEKAGISDIRWVVGDAERLPFPDNSFDVYTIAFGIRNCTHIDLVLDEAYRVLKPRGRFFCLEFSQVITPLFRGLYDAYSLRIIPVIGQLVAGDWASYQYLVESIRRFPNQSEFSELIQDAGFSSVQVINYSNGICAVHSGFKEPLHLKTGSLP
ncbi:unnamed protein product [Dicrocoelium dendriticum]|nr:unnamed protein product [Dicrocoelium dendriticum]